MSSFKHIAKHIVLAGASALALSTANLPALAEGVSFTLIPRAQQSEAAQIDLQRFHDFEAAVTLSVRIDPALIPSARVIKMVERIGMVDGSGLRIERGYAIDVAHDLVVGFSGGSAEIAAIREDEHGLIMAVLFRDDQGQIVEPPEDSLALYTTGGEKLCFAHEVVENEETITSSIAAPGITSANPMAFTVLADRSGSMAGVRAQVDDAIRAFLGALPDGAQCTLGGFASTYSFAASDGYGTARCKPENFSLAGGADLGGSTDLFSPLREVYTSMADPALGAHQKAVIIITDGGLNESLGLQSQLVQMRGEVVTFVYFLGGSSDTHLRALAHNYLDHEGDLTSALDRYFEVVSTAYTKQTVLRVLPCAESHDE